MSAETAMPPNLVFLGASNLTLCRDHAVRISAERFPEGARLFLADGLGRSYLADSRALARSLTSIAECGLWDAVQGTPPATVYALLTDFGNDLVYGRTAAEITGSVEQALDRLQDLGARCTLTGLPLDAIRSTSWFRFHFFKTILFPFHPLSRTALIEEAEALEANLRRVAEERDLGFVAPRHEWYGPDPIHVYGKAQALAYGAYLSDLLGPPAAGAKAPEGYRRARRLPHAARAFFGLQQRYDQPSLRLGGGRFEISVF